MIWVTLNMLSVVEECREPSWKCQGISHCLESGHPDNCVIRTWAPWVLVTTMKALYKYTSCTFCACEVSDFLFQKIRLEWTESAMLLRCYGDSCRTLTTTLERLLRRWCTTSDSARWDFQRPTINARMKCSKSMYRYCLFTAAVMLPVPCSLSVACACSITSGLWFRWWHVC